MKSKIIFILLLQIFISHTSYCQSGNVKYKITIHRFSNNKDEEMNILLNKMFEAAEKQEFTLQFSNDKSIFKNNNKLIANVNSDENKINNVATAAFTSSTIIYDKINGILYDLNSNDALTTIKTNDSLWDITNESKTIDKYKCFKALYTVHFLTRRGEKNSRIITAWFAPSLPYGYGPKNYTGLPGLILELIDKETTYLATSIEISNKTINIEIPKGKIITKEVYEAKLKSQMGM